MWGGEVYRYDSGVSLQDARGCLTAEGVAALAQAPAGQAPPDLALHVAGCPRCQDRVLVAGAGPRKAAGEPPPIWRALLVVFAAFAMAIVALITFQRLMAP